MTAQPVDLDAIRDQQERWVLTDSGLDHAYRIIENRLKHAMAARDRAETRVRELRDQLHLARELQRARVVERERRRA